MKKKKLQRVEPDIMAGFNWHTRLVHKYALIGFRAQTNHQIVTKFLSPCPLAYKMLGQTFRNKATSEIRLPWGINEFIDLPAQLESNNS